jgi:hypothetical protein
MHVEVHHDDLFSWKKYNNYTHMSVLEEYRHEDSTNVAANYSLKYNVLTLLAADSAVSRLE